MIAQTYFAFKINKVTFSRIEKLDGVDILVLVDSSFFFIISRVARAFAQLYSLSHT
jgi:hypothetical protein